MARILIVDDVPHIRDAMQYLVEKAGHEVVGMAENGVEAFDLYISAKPDLVTMDILMKGTDGIAAVKHIMSHDPAAKILIVSALDQGAKKRRPRVSASPGIS